MYEPKCPENVQDYVARFYPMYNGLKPSALADYYSATFHTRVMLWSTSVTLSLHSTKSTLKSKDPLKELVTDIH